MTPRRLLRLGVAPLPLVLVAAGAGVVAPSSGELARRSDLILAALVLALAVTIEPPSAPAPALAREP